MVYRYLNCSFQYYEKMSQRIEEQRNQYEAEKERELLKKFLKEKAAALEKQWQECEKLKEEAIAMACEALSRKLRTEFVMEKEQEIAEALRIAKVVHFSTFRNVKANLKKNLFPLTRPCFTGLGPSVGKKIC